MLILGLIIASLTFVLVSASTASYSITLPTFGHKTVATGSKNNTYYYAYNMVGNGEIYYTGWIDIYTNGSWDTITSDYYCGPNTNVYMYYNYTPSWGSSLRLRTKGSTLFGGQSIIGSIGF